VYPGVARVAEGNVIRYIADDGKSAEIVYSACAEADIDQLIAEQIQAAQTNGYELEWKVYGHDQPPSLAERLTAAGFEPDDREAFLVFSATAEAVSRFGTRDFDIRRVTDREGLEDYCSVWEEVRNRTAAIEHYAEVLENSPDTMSVYVAYVNNEPAACGRTSFHPNSQFAGLWGGSTREKFRKRGLFTALVAARIREAVSRGIEIITVDALPTSEPILTKRGFQFVTYTQPFCLPH